MPAEKLTIQVEGAKEEGGNVRLADFVDQLEAIKAALRYSDQLAGVKAYYRVVDLRHKSPATIVLERVVETPADSREAGRVGAGGPRDLLAGLREVRAVRAQPAKGREQEQASRPEQPPRPPVTDFEKAETYRAIAETVNVRVNRLILRSSRQSVTIDQAFRKKLETAIGPDEVQIGSVAGRLRTSSNTLTRRCTVSASLRFSSAARTRCGWYFFSTLRMSTGIGLVLPQFLMISSKARAAT